MPSENSPEIFRLRQRVEELELALRVTQRRLTDISEHSPAMLWITGPDSLATFFSKRKLDFVGMSHDEAVGLGHTAAIHPEDVDEYLKTYLGAFHARRDFELEYRLRRRDGVYCWVLDRGVPRLNPDGSFGGYVGSCFDITYRRGVENAMEEDRSWLKVTLSSIADGVLAADIENRVLLLNPVAQTLTGWVEEDAAGRSTDDVITLLEESDRSPTAPPTPESGKVLSAILISKTGKETLVDCRSAPIRDRKGTVSGSVIVFHDATARQRAATELARSNFALQQFASMASHDLQEPLRSIGGYTKLFAKRYSGAIGGDADEMIEFILDGVNRMSLLIADVLAYSKIDDGSPRILKPVDLAEVFEGVRTNLHYSISESEAEITQGPLPTIHAERFQMVQLFQNLLSNAIKYRAERALRVHASAAQIAGLWKISLRDNGIGIDAEFHERIFHSFRRLHGREYPGTGIGLAICKKIVERHGGELWVESALDAGSTFHFTIPERQE